MPELFYTDCTNHTYSSIVSKSYRLYYINCVGTEHTL